MTGGLSRFVRNNPDGSIDTRGVEADKWTRHYTGKSAVAVASRKLGLPDGQPPPPRRSRRKKPK